jgi:Cys-tRNA(Pro)/Cys-tRNA(Cys) deacylase
MTDIPDRIILPAHLYLDQLGLKYERRSFPPETEKGAANVARALGFRERQMIKTLIFETDRGEKSLIMLGGDQTAISGQLKKALGSRNIHLASPETVLATTGYVIGSIPPFSWQPAGFRSFLDESLMSEEILGVGTGQWGEEILISPGNLIIASKAQVVNLTERDKPIPPA